MSRVVLPTLTWSESYWTTTINLPAWRGFQSRRGPYASRDTTESSDGTVEISFAAPDNDQNLQPSFEQENAYQFLVNEQVQIRDRILDAVFQEYPRFQDYYSDDEVAEFAPAIDDPGELRGLIGLHSVHVLETVRESVAYIGFEFGCSWDPEHGLGVMTHRSRILKIGGADTSFLEWIAAADAKLEE